MSPFQGSERSPRRLRVKRLRWKKHFDRSMQRKLCASSCAMGLSSSSKRSLCAEPQSCRTRHSIATHQPCGIRFHLPEDQPVFRKTRVVWKTGWSSGRRKMCRSILVLSAPPVDAGIQETCLLTVLGRFVHVVFWSSGRPIRLLEDRFRLPEDQSVFRKKSKLFWKTGLPEDETIFRKTETDPTRSTQLWGVGW